MKRLLALLLALLFIVPAAALGEENAYYSYASDFSTDTDGWYARSAGEASIAVQGNALTITGRNATWNSPGRDFNLLPGKKYQISVQVMQSAEANVEFMISAAHSKNGLESYENLGKAKVPKGCWTTITATYTPAEFDNYILYVETVGSGTIDFSIRNFKIELDELFFNMSLPSLAELYAPYFDLGAAINQAQVLDTSRMAFCDHQFNILTHENELKPDSVLDVNTSRNLAKEDDTAVAVHFNAAKPMLDFCQENGLKVHGHVLVWHSQTPDVFFREGYKSNGDYVSREVMLARMENYIRQVFEYTEANYPGLIVSWDVVNEAVSDNSSSLRESNWTKVVGQDFVNRAFEFARKYAPEGVKLYYNDYSTPYEPKLTGICKLLDSLIAEGNIDGYGFQCHYSTTTPTPTQVRNAMQKIAAKGLLLRVSELDVGISNTSDVNLTLQAARFADLFQIFVDFADQMEAVQVWGLTDDRSWRADEYPLLFNDRCMPKPAFYSVVELVEKAQ